MAMERSCIRAACDELRGGMDVYQYKDYAAGVASSSISATSTPANHALWLIPEGSSSFTDTGGPQGQGRQFGDDINKKVA